YLNDPGVECHLSGPEIERYMSKISGPLLDRIDLHLEVPAVPFKELSAAAAGTSSESMTQSVVAARQFQHKRFAGSATRHNGQMAHRQIRAFCQLDDTGNA